MTCPGTCVALFLIRFQHLAGASRHQAVWGFVNFWTPGDTVIFLEKKNLELEKDVLKMWISGTVWIDFHAFKAIFGQGFQQILLEKVRFAEENAQPRLKIGYPSHRTASSPLSHGHRVRKTR